MVVQWTKVKGLCPDDFCSTYPLHWRKTFSVHIIIQNMNLASQTFSVNIIIQIMNLASQSVQEKKKKISFSVQKLHVLTSLNLRQIEISISVPPYDVIIKNRISTKRPKLCPVSKRKTLVTKG